MCAARVLHSDKLDIRAQLLGDRVWRAQRPGFDRLDRQSPGRGVLRKKLPGAVHSVFEFRLAGVFVVAVGDRDGRAGTEFPQRQ